MTLYKPRNMVGSTIASGSNFVHGTDSQIELTDAGDFDSEGGYIRIDDGSQWALYEYTGKNSNTLTGLTAANYIAESTSSHTFSEGTPVTVEATADLWRDIVSIFRGDMTWALSNFSNITGVDRFKVDTAANLSAGVSNRICFETDTGRVLYDNGASFVELGLAEGEISLGELGSLDASGNPITNVLSLVISDTGDDVRIRKNGSGNFELYNDTDSSVLLSIDENTAEVLLSGDIDLGSSHQVVNMPDPTSAQDAATKSYVDAIEQGLDIKDSVVAATDGANIDLTSSTDPNPIDGVTLSDSERVLLKDQTTASENGIYTTVTATDPSSWIRSNDADEDDEVTAGMFVFVEEGTVNQNRGFVVTSNDPITVGSSDISFTQFSGAGQISAGDGLNKSGDTINHDSASVHENGGALEITHNNLTLNPDDHHTKTTDLGDLADVLGISEIKMDTASNLTAGTPDRLCLETDTGRVLYDNGTSFIELGLSESEITLGNLGSLDAGDNSIKNLLAILNSAQSSAPSSPSNGDFYMDDGTNTEDGYAGLRQYTNGAWEDVGAGGGGSNAFSFFMG